MRSANAAVLLLATAIASAPATGQVEAGSAIAQCTNDSVVTLSIGQRVELRATSAGGIPYQWRVRNDGTVLESVGSPRALTQGEPMPGGPVTRVWTFVAVREGSQDLGADLVSLGPDTTVARSVHCTVVARRSGGGG